MSEPDSIDLLVELAKLGERIEGLRIAVNLADQTNDERQSQSEARIRDDVAKMDKRINGRITRAEASIGNLEREIYSEKVFLARVQGAAEERERHGLPPDPLPPPVPNGPPAADPPSATVPRWVQVVAGLSAAIAALLGGVAALSPLIEAVTK